jgi:hypothetical protein
VVGKSNMENCNQKRKSHERIFEEVLKGVDKIITIFPNKI